MRRRVISWIQFFTALPGDLSLRFAHYRCSRPGQLVGSSPRSGCLPVRRRPCNRRPRNPVATKTGRPHPRRPQKVVRPERLLSDEWKLATRSRRRAPPTIIFWASLINREFAAALILSIETLDCRVTFRDIAHRNEPKAARLAGFAIHDQFDFRNSAERLKEFPQRAFCHVKGKISDVKLHDDK